ncbi:atrial natriuretic peptide receptor 2-like isoform X2 [Anopheles albimanus]|uniref:atrial natriuretic peptide receptor 2-like isoform X2 n=1 Tax=Anopheles albimanus TaxID=7167 RepID=UPI001641EECD|nr:atrial natriuretic peptide receptor 2-like isoform X2 [Anopheles albimanus]XP_035782979.1 atrial natriuretic peptide receptor 2-like isoform X2 [Anopheles albimanus]
MVRPAKCYGFRTASPVSPVLPRPKEEGTWFLAAILFTVGLGIVMLPSVDAGCRSLARRECEQICGTNGTCQLRIVVIMPDNTSVEASWPRVEPVLMKAEEDIRRRSIIPAKVNISWIWYDDECEQARATVMAMDGTGSETCGHVILGPTCDFALAPVARIARYIYNDGIPVITGAGYTFDFEEPKTLCENEFHMLIRTGLVSFKRMAYFMIDLIRHFKWNRVVYFYDRHSHYNVAGAQTGHLLMNTMAEFFRHENITYSPFSTDSARTNLTESLKEKVGVNYAIVIMCASPATIREIMLAAAELNMVSSGEYVFFNIEIFGSMAATKNPPWYSRNDTDERNQKAKEAYTALLQVVAREPEDEEYQQFSNEVKMLTKEKYKYNYADDEPVSTFVTAFYDAVLLYAYALNDSIAMLGEEQALHQPINGTHLAQLMWGRSFKGITGNVTIDSNGDRISNYSLLDLNPTTGLFEVVANYYYGGGLQFVEGKPIHWAGDRTTAPPDRPTCGFDGSLCPDNSLPGYAILSLVLGLCVICMGIAFIIGYRHYKLESEINSMTWKVNPNDVLSCNPSRVHRGSLHSIVKRGSQATIYSEDLNSLPGDRQIYIHFGFYKGCKVAIKKINVHNISLNRSLMLEFKRMKDIQHDHLVRFYGACLDPHPEPFILTEYCPKGSLQDILENETIKLDWMFKISLMHDIVKGMAFLHSTDLHSHGALKSSNCVVDSRFVLKVTDFGLHQLRRNCEESDIESYAYWKKLLWTAPELLRDPHYSMSGSQKGDVYSFGIIIHEIVSRQGPFYLGTEEKSPKEIIKLVKEGPGLLGVLFRPRVDESSYEDVNNIMIKCWSEDPTERPDFGALKTIIRKINKENESGNILDNLLQRMEQYANNLEALVDERTRDYFEEKRKCEELLYQLLPKSVAAQLIMGKSVIAETYDQVTIYFSDIVGFTAISAQSTPMQVVDLLNDLYTCFDSIVENFDVYKVETIGDAYMVVSGLPVRNGNLHAREISRMALRLLAAVHKFTIRHRPNEQLRLRIGLHSGPCVAGVVGLKMPRYCLFGDTVNTASRMESNGEALKIHVSQTTKTLLDCFGTFDLTERGLVPMKGKGEMLTYWLNGERSEVAPFALPNGLKALPAPVAGRPQPPPNGGHSPPQATPIAQAPALNGGPPAGILTNGNHNNNNNNNNTICSLNNNNNNNGSSNHHRSPNSCHTTHHVAVSIAPTAKKLNSVSYNFAKAPPNSVTVPNVPPKVSGCLMKGKGLLATIGSGDAGGSASDGGVGSSGELELLHTSTSTGGAGGSVTQPLLTS